MEPRPASSSQTAPDGTARQTYAAKIDLILWRLEKMEAQLSAPPTKEQEAAEREAFRVRLAALEKIGEEERKERRTLATGVLVALSVPIVRLVLQVIEQTGF